MRLVLIPTVAFIFGYATFGLYILNAGLDPIEVFWAFWPWVSGVIPGIGLIGLIGYFYKHRDVL